MTERIQSFEEFWPFYLSEHRNPVSRRLHFLGTAGFFGVTAVTTAATLPVSALGLAGFASFLAWGAKREPKQRPLLQVAGAVVSAAVTNPMFLAGVAVAYSGAWTGHFGFEKNVPATFQYPVWSFMGDMRMFGHMMRGQLWSGDPLDELGLSQATNMSVEAAAVTN